jgi:2'-5' RNA ligase
MRYILALVPTREVATTYIQTAQTLFGNHHDSYLLSEKVSPHITVCQFETEQESKATLFWHQIDTLSNRKLFPRLTGVSFQKGMGKLKEFYWAEVSVAREEALMKVHQFALDALEKCGLHSVNDSGDLYRPHITLARIRLPETIQRWPDELFEDQGEYKLALALGDDHGQYLSTIFEA